MSTTVYACSLMPHGSVRTIYREEAKPKPKASSPVAQWQSQQIIPESNPERKKKSVNSNMLPGGLQQCKLISDSNFPSPHGTIYLNHMDLVVCPSASSKWEPLSSSLNKVARQVRAQPGRAEMLCYSVTTCLFVGTVPPSLPIPPTSYPPTRLPPSIGPSSGFSIPS